VNFILHIDQNLISFVTHYGVWAYVLLFLIIFCETGLVVAPFLPGDSLLFASGALAAHAGDALNIHVLFMLLVVASTLGNTANYFIGKFIGPRIFHQTNSYLFNRKYLEKAHRFYQQHGGKAIIIARFIPIIRTFVPFLAGVGYMEKHKFFIYNFIGALLWIGSLLYISYLFGNIPIIRNHFPHMIIAIILLSLFPPIIELLRQRYWKPG